MSDDVLAKLDKGGDQMTQKFWMVDMKDGREEQAARREYRRLDGLSFLFTTRALCSAPKDRKPRLRERVFGFIERRLGR